MNDKLNKYLPSSDILFLQSGRGAFHLILELLNLGTKDKVLIPAYLPQGIMQPLLKKDVGFAFYDINLDFSVNVSNIENLIDEKTKALLLIHYFGFPQPIEEIKKICREKGIYLVEDCAQAFMSQYPDGDYLGKYGDFSLYSFTKTFRVLDGAGLIINNNEISQNLKNKEPKGNFISKIYILLRRISILKKNDLASLKIKALSHKLSYMILNNYLVKPLPISSNSLDLLKKEDFEKVKLQRIKSFEYYLENLNPNFHIPFHEINNFICPFGFPLLIKNRDKVYNTLKENGVYCLKNKGWTFITEKDSENFPNSWRVVNEILTLPVNQFADEGAIKAAVDILNTSYNGSHSFVY